jgi:hypothetical protein
MYYIHVIYSRDNDSFINKYNYTIINTTKNIFIYQDYVIILNLSI